MRRRAQWSLLAVLFGVVVCVVAQPPAFGSCPIFPIDHIWNTPGDRLPVSPNSAMWVNTIGAASPIHPDFGSGTYNGGPIGIPYVMVPGTQSLYPATFYSGFTKLISIPCSDLGCWAYYEDTIPSTSSSEHRPSVPSGGCGTESYSTIAVGHRPPHWRRPDCHDDWSVSPNQWEPGPRCPALRDPSRSSLPRRPSRTPCWGACG